MLSSIKWISRLAVAFNISWSSREMTRSKVTLEYLSWESSTFYTINRANRIGLQITIVVNISMFIL